MIEIIDVRTSPAVIKVLGVGGGGQNAVNRMIDAGLGGVEFWVANTDLQALENAACMNRLQIGRTTTRGLGAGGDPDVGRLSAEEDRDSIAAAISGADMLFITAGMGGGTGTGAAPIVAEIAHQLGILTVAIVTKPFLFEGKKKMNRALKGIEALATNVDTLIPIPNQKLLNIVQPGTPFSAAMLVADEVLFQATRGISDLITGHGMINLDFADVKSVMHQKGNALLGCGIGSGPNRALEAAQNAVSSPLLEEVSILGAEALLINVQGGPEMGLHEAAEATQFIADRVGDDADVFWGAVIDPSLGEEMRVTIIATGFVQAAAAPSASAAAPGAAAESPRMDTVRGETARVDPARVESPRVDPARVEPARTSRPGGDAAPAVAPAASPAARTPLPGRAVPGGGETVVPPREAPAAPARDPQPIAMSYRSFRPASAAADTGSAPRGIDPVGARRETEPRRDAETRRELDPRRDAPSRPDADPRRDADARRDPGAGRGPDSEADPAAPESRSARALRDLAWDLQATFDRNRDRARPRPGAEETIEAELFLTPENPWGDRSGSRDPRGDGTASAYSSGEADGWGLGLEPSAVRDADRGQALGEGLDAAGGSSERRDAAARDDEPRGGDRRGNGDAWPERGDRPVRDRGLVVPLRDQMRVADGGRSFGRNPLDKPTFMRKKIWD